MDNHNVHALLLQETRIPGTTQYISGDCQFIMVGNQRRLEYAGVCFIVSLKVRPAVAGVRVINSRLALLRMSTGPRELQL
eukprot:1989518-Alexandrium_andersonii.AAC.1